MNYIELKTRSTPVEQLDKEICGICKRQTSRYTCPSCNVPYCSLTCFRSEAHSECSETFYRKEIESDIRAEPTKSAKEKRQMMELLRRFEEQNAQEPYETLEDDEEDLARKLEGINLDNADSEALWKILSPTQRDSFLKAMRDPSSDLAQQLLSSTELERARRRPWWESPSVNIDDHSEDTNEFGTLPRMLSVPQGLMMAHKEAGSTNSLVYNILSLCLAYAYVTRRLSISPLSSLDPGDSDRDVALELLSRLAPFLTDRKSKQLFENVDSLITDVWSRLEGLSDPPSRESFALFLADAARLIRPQRMVVIKEDELESHKSRLTLLVISDLAELFSSSSRHVHVMHKLNFYAAHLCSQSVDFLSLVADEIRVAGLEMQM